MADLPDVNDHIFDTMSYMKKLMEMESYPSATKDMLNAEFPAEAQTATEVMMREKERQRVINGGRSHGKSALLGAYQQVGKLRLGTVSGRWSSPNALSPVRPSGKAPVAFPVGLFQGQSGALLIMDDTPVPTNTIQDRQHLKLTVSEYQNFSEAVMSQCYLDRDGNRCKVKNAKLKKLKNLRYKIKKSEFLSKSMIWNAQLRVIEDEISKRQKISRGQFS